MQSDSSVYKPYIYLNWKSCMQKQKDFRKELALPENEKEDEQMCRYAFRLHFENKIKKMKTNCCKTNYMTEDDDY